MVKWNVEIKIVYRKITVAFNDADAATDFAATILTQAEAEGDELDVSVVPVKVDEVKDNE